jgi:TRAP-type C4-dicarboxylate transport system substrate-binding protein
MRFRELAVMSVLTIAITTQNLKAEDLSAVTFLPENSSFIQPFKELIERINASGETRVSLIGGPEAIPPFEQANAASTGAVDIAVLPVNYYRNIAIEAETLQLIPGSFHEMRGEAYWQIIEDSHRRGGLELIAVYGDTVPFYTYLVSPISELDFDGLRLRVSPVYSEFYKALGASVVNLPPSEIHAALNARSIDGFGWPAWDLTTVGWDEFVKYRVEPGFYKTAIAVVMNKDKWQGLSDRKSVV